MSAPLTIDINGQPREVEPGCSVAAALIHHKDLIFRDSVTGQKRGPLCGMGICYECRVTINGQFHRRSCMILCQDGMKVETA